MFAFFLFPPHSLFLLCAAVASLRAETIWFQLTATFRPRGLKLWSEAHLPCSPVLWSGASSNGRGRGLLHSGSIPMWKAPPPNSDVILVPSIYILRTQSWAVPLGDQPQSHKLLSSPERFIRRVVTQSLLPNERSFWRTWKLAKFLRHFGSCCWTLDFANSYEPMYVSSLLNTPRPPLRLYSFFCLLLPEGSSHNLYIQLITELLEVEGFWQIVPSFHTMSESGL